MDGDILNKTIKKHDDLISHMDLEYEINNNNIYVTTYVGIYPKIHDILLFYESPRHWY
jgi:hypothetical protein